MSLLQDSFIEQAGYCENLGSPFMGRLLRLMAAHWPKGCIADQIASDWDGDIGPMAASLPLRICGGLHALVLKEKDAALGKVYPPADVPDTVLWPAVERALIGHGAFWRDWLQNAPQTNEVRRAAVLIAVARLLTDRFNLPIRLSELGASGGLNLMFDRFALDLDGQHFGPSSDVQLSPDWQGPLPCPTDPVIAERRGVDLNPLDAQHPEDALRLVAYLWPDQMDRLTRTRAAIELQDAPVDKSDAIEWLQTRLPHVPGQLHLIYHTIAWQYFPPDAQRRGQAMIEAAGAHATQDTPLAWVQMEADDNDNGAGLRLRLWPGNHDLALGRVDFHGRWVKWTGPKGL